MDKIDFNSAPKQDFVTEIDFETVKAVALDNIEYVLHHWLPGGRLSGSEYVCAGIGGGQGTSCSTNIRTGVGGDFAGVDRWGDLIELVAISENVNMGEAARILTDFLRIDSNTPKPQPIPRMSEEDRRKHALEVSAALWAQGEACPPDHPYLVKKHVNADQGIRYHSSTGNILVPLRDGADIMAVQRIFPDGEKKVNHGGMFVGCYHIIQGDRDVVYICEGYSTAMTVHMITNKTAIMTVSAGNIPEVARKIASAYPSSMIVFAADNDNVTPKNPSQIKNPGMTFATKARDLIARGVVVCPPADPETKVDWNDYAIAAGGQAAYNILLKPVRDGGSKRLFMSAAEQIESPIKIEYLIHNVLEERTINSIFGPPASGKSFLTFDIACHIVTGRPWNGHEVAKPGAVLILAGEGRGGIIRRLRAWCRHNEVAASELRSLFISRQTIMMDGSNTESICAEMDGVDVSLIVVDTLARHLVGDENSTPDMTAFIQHVDALRERLNTTAMIVHHSGHSDAQRSRGNSSFKAALDSEIQCKDNWMTWTKTKDMEPPEAIQFKLVPVEIGTDDKGEKIMSCVVEYGKQPAGTHRAVKLTAHEKTALRALMNVCIDGGCIDAKGRYTALFDEWRDEFYRIRKIEEPDVAQSSLKKQFQRARTTGNGAGLTDKRIVEMTENGASLITPDDNSTVNMARLSRNGTRDIGGTQARHVPASKRDILPGHTPPIRGGVPHVPPRTSVGLEFGEAGQNPDTHSEGDNEPF